METALPILLLLGFLIGVGVLLLACGYRGREQERAESNPLEDIALKGLPRFFGTWDVPVIANPVVVADETAALQLEEFLRREMALAEVFVAAPSVELLHRSRDEKKAASLFERLESRLREEHEAAATFVSNPSIESLYGPAVSPASSIAQPRNRR